MAPYLKPDCVLEDRNPRLRGSCQQRCSHTSALGGQTADSWKSFALSNWRKLACPKLTFFSSTEGGCCLNWLLLALNRLIFVIFFSPLSAGTHERSSCMSFNAACWNQHQSSPLWGVMYGKAYSVMMAVPQPGFSASVPTTWDLFLTYIIIPKWGVHCMPAEQMVMQGRPEFHPGSLLHSLPALL